MTIDSGCEMHVCGPYLESKFNHPNFQQTAISSDTLPGWLEVKIRHRPSLISLLFYLMIGQIFGIACSFLMVVSFISLSTQ